MTELCHINKRMMHVSLLTVVIITCHRYTGQKACIRVMLAELCLWAWCSINEHWVSIALMVQRVSYRTHIWFPDTYFGLRLYISRVQAQHSYRSCCTDHSVRLLWHLTIGTSWPTSASSSLPPQMPIGARLLVTGDCSVPTAHRS